MFQLTKFGPECPKLDRLAPLDNQNLESRREAKKSKSRSLNLMYNFSYSRTRENTNVNIG